MDINKELKLLSNEDIVWIIYLFVIILAIYTNKLERNYIINKDKIYMQKASKLNTFILIVAFLIYLYFVILAMDNIKNSNNETQKRIAIERLIVSITFLIAGAIAIYTDYDNKVNNLDIAIF